MAMMRPEIEMKESGIEWVGSIPEDWKVAKNNRLFNISKKIVNENWKDTQLLSLTKSGIVEKNINDGGGKQPESFETYQYVEQDDIVLCLFDIDVSAVFSDRSKYDGMISSAYRVIKCTNAILSVYAKWWFDAVNIGRYYLIYTKSLRKTIDADGFGNILTVVPPLSEQQAIADYLDETCSQIDEIIAEAKASIDEYKELKQSVIFEAVTKGLDKNVEMKDSCVEWIGEIPSSWQLRKLKTFTVMISKGTTPKDMSNVKTTLYCVRYLKSENIKNNHLDIVPEFYITEETHNELSRSKLNGNDILFVIAGASIGKVAIMDENLLPANTNQANAFIRIKDEFMDSIEYLWMLLQSVIVKEVINRYSVQSAQPNISMENLGNIKLPYPLLKRERDNIMNYLREKVDAIDSLISEKESLINDLEAYKKSLIYEVVTGKRRVV